MMRLRNGFGWGELAILGFLGMPVGICAAGEPVPTSPSPVVPYRAVFDEASTCGDFTTSYLDKQEDRERRLLKMLTQEHRKFEQYYGDLMRQQQVLLEKQQSYRRKFCPLIFAVQSETNEWFRRQQSQAVCEQMRDLGAEFQTYQQRLNALREDMESHASNFLAVDGNLSDHDKKVFRVIQDLKLADEPGITRLKNELLTSWASVVGGKGVSPLHGINHGISRAAGDLSKKIEVIHRVGSEMLERGNRCVLAGQPRAERVMDKFRRLEAEDKAAKLKKTGKRPTGST